MVLTYQRLKCQASTYMYTFRLEFILTELSIADRPTSCVFILAAIFICMSRPNGLEYYNTATVKSPDDIFFCILYGEACSLQEQK